MNWKYCVETFPHAAGRNSLKLQYGWHLKSKNGNIMCGGEGHSDRHKARRAALAVQKAFAIVPSTIPFFDLKARP